MTDVTIIGLGQMGAALADLMLRAGKSVSLWNRTPEKAADLIARGALLEPSLAAAVAASPATIICVYDYDAAQAILEAEGVAASLAERTVINLGTGSPEEAIAAETFVNACGGRYLDGAIQAAPSQMGAADTPVLISGDPAVYQEVADLLSVLAGNFVHLGARIEAAAYMDLATLSHVYGAFAGFLHGARMAEATGISVETYGRLVKDISPSFGAFFGHEGAVIESGDFTITESPMRISVTAVERILRTSEALGINSEVPALMNGWLQQARAAGLVDKELAALIQIVRASGSRPVGQARDA